MLDANEDSDSDNDLCIDEREEPPSPKRQKTSENQNISTDNISPESNTKPSELINVRNHSAELPPVNDTNLLNANEEMPRLTIKKFARITDAANSNEDEDSDFLALLIENKINILADIEQNTAISVNNEVLRAEAQNNDPRLRRATAATDYQRSPGSHMNTPQDQRVPILQNPFEIQNGNIPHMLRAPSINADRQAGANVPYSGNHLEGAMSYGPHRLTHRHNGVNTIYPTAMTNVWPVQNGHQPQIYACAPAEYNEQAANYNHRAPPPMSQMHMSAHSTNHQQMSSMDMGMTYNGQRLTLTNSQLKSVPMNSCQNFYLNGYESSTNFVPQNDPYTDRHFARYIAKIQLDNFNLKRKQLMKTEATYEAGTSYQLNVRSGVKSTNKSAGTKISNYKHINCYKHQLGNTSTTSSTYNNIRGSGAGLNIPNRDAFRIKEADARKRAVKPNSNTLKAKASLPVKHQVHAPSNMWIPERNNIKILSFDLTSACTQPSMYNIPNLTQPPLYTGANLTTMSTNTPKAKTPMLLAQAPMSKECNLHSAATYINNNGAQNVLVEAPQAVNINMNRDSAQIPPIMDQQTNMNLNINKATVKRTKLNTAPILAAMDMATTAKTLQTGDFIKPANNNTNWQITMNLFNNNYRAQTDAIPTPKTLVLPSSNAYGVKESTTSTTIEKKLTSASINAETDSVQGIANANSILKTVDHRIETRVTTIGVVNQIFNRPIEYFQDILNNVQQIPTKTAAIVDQNYENQVRKCDDTDNYNDNNKMIAHTTTSDHHEARIDHELQVIVVSTPELEIARKKLARWSAIKRKAPRDSENQYEIKIPTDVYGEYIAQVIKEHFIDYSPIRTEQRSGNNNENISLLQRRLETKVLERHRSMKNYQEINKSSIPRENIMNTTLVEAKWKIDENIEAPVPMVSNNSETNSNAAKKDAATEKSTNERKSYSRNSLSNQKDCRDRRPTDNSVTTGLPLSPERAKTDDQARANAKHVLDGSRTTQCGNTKDCVVKIPRNRLKESIVKGLMQRKNVKSNTVSTEAATGTSPATRDRNSNASMDSSDNNKNLEKHRKTPCENDEQSSDNATRVTEEVLNNIRNTLRENCISNEEELPQVKIPGRKQKEVITKEKKTKSKAHQPSARKKMNEEIYRCPVCNIDFSLPLRFLSHLRENHSIEDRTLPPHCIHRLCESCGIYIKPKSYKTHVINVHNDTYNKKPNKPKKLILKLNTEVVSEKYVSLEQRYTCQNE